MNEIKFVNKYTLAGVKNGDIIINNNVVWFYKNYPKWKISKSYYHVSIYLKNTEAINIFEEKYKWKYRDSAIEETHPDVYIKDFVPEKIKVYKFLRLR